MLARRLMISSLVLGVLIGHCGRSVWSAEPLGMPTVQILFLGPEGSRLSGEDAWPGETEAKEIALPGRRNFPPSNFVRLRLTNVPGHSAQSFFPLVEIGGITPRTHDYLHRNAVPIRFTAEDLDAASQGAACTNVVYLLDRAVEGPHEGDDVPQVLASGSLEAGLDPILEADRRGTILAVIRIRVEKLGPPLAKMVEPQTTPAHDSQRASPQTLVLDPPRGRLARTLRFSQVGRGPWRARRR